MYNSRLKVNYYARDWPGSRTILYPDMIAQWRWNYPDFFTGGLTNSSVQKYVHIDPDPNSEYHFLLEFQFTQSMRESVLSLPSRIHVPGTGKNTYQIPYYDLYPTLDIVTEHDDYVVLMHIDIEGKYALVVKEDDTIRDLASLTEEDAPELQKMREIIAQSKAIHPDFKLFNFQVAGVAAMLLIFGVSGSMVPGVSNIRRCDSISTMSEPKDQTGFDFDAAISELSELIL